jgi:predicted ester cyclase
VTDDVATELRALYRRYNEACNAHAFERLGEFVATDVRVNGEVQGLDAYTAGLRSVVDAFPDYRWDLRHLVVDPPWVAAHFVDTGVHTGTFLGVPATGRAVSLQEFSFYRLQDRRIVEVWVAAENLHLLEQLH